MRKLLSLLVLGLGLFWTAPGLSEEDILPMPTLGGMQFWGDELFFHQWRIQRNVLSGHCRLLDGSNFRHAWGTYDECAQALESIKRQKKLPPMKGKAVLVLHGLGHSRIFMGNLCDAIEKKGGYVVFNVSYPSTRQDIAAHARALAKIIAHLDGIDEINIVAHSMGNIVTRHYLFDQTEPATGRKPDPRLRRMVMLGPPNQGSIAAQALADDGLFNVITGKPGQQLGAEWDELRKHLATPAFEFGIIAGGRGNGKGYNPLLPGDNDGVVTVESTKLSGAADFVVVPSLHALMMDNATIQEYTVQFLKNGYFIAPDRKQPLP